MERVIVTSDRWSHGYAQPHVANGLQRFDGFFQAVAFADERVGVKVVGSAHDQFVH